MYLTVFSNEKRASALEVKGDCHERLEARTLHADTGGQGEAA